MEYASNEPYTITAGIYKKNFTDVKYVTLKAYIPESELINIANLVSMIEKTILEKGTCNAGFCFIIDPKTEKTERTILSDICSIVTDIPKVSTYVEE